MRHNTSASAAASTTETSDVTTTTTTTAVVEDSLFDIKIEMDTAGLIPYYSRRLLKEVTKENALTIAKYILAMKTEINLSDHYRQDVIYLLSKLSICCNNSNNNNNNKSFKQISRQDILSFLDNYRKPESADPLHKWIGTYNIYRIHFVRFFKWLYYPDIEPNKRPKPQVIEIFLF
jgi:hypothetical protein